jgi:hypothetical protein
LAKLRVVFSFRNLQHPLFLISFASVVRFESAPEISNGYANNSVISGIEIGRPVEDGLGDSQLGDFIGCTLQKLLDEELENGAQPRRTGEGKVVGKALEGTPRLFRNQNSRVRTGHSSRQFYHRRILSAVMPIRPASLRDVKADL